MDTSLRPREVDVQRMLACEVHIGTRNSDFQMERYVWRRRADGIHLIHLGRPQEVWATFDVDMQPVYKWLYNI